MITNYMTRDLSELFNWSRRIKEDNPYAHKYSEMGRLILAGYTSEEIDEAIKAGRKYLPNADQSPK